MERNEVLAYIRENESKTQPKLSSLSKYLIPAAMHSDAGRTHWNHYYTPIRLLRNIIDDEKLFRAALNALVGALVSDLSALESRLNQILTDSKARNGTLPPRNHGHINVVLLRWHQASVNHRLILAAGRFVLELEPYPVEA